MRRKKTEQIIHRLDEMVTDAMNGTYEEENYDETELSRLEAKWKQYISASEHSIQETGKERQNIKALVSDISHQTKTPLSNILLYTELLKERMQGTREEVLAEQIQSEAEKLEFLIKSLIKLSRLESKVLEIKTVSQELAPLLEAVADAVRIKAVQKSIEVIYVHTSSVRASFDRQWTEEALFNLLDNAVKYAPVGSKVALGVEVYELFVCIYVRDEGMGIREEEMNKIFGRFYRSEDAHEEEGTGLGLYLAREIVRREGGYIKVESQYGQGSCFKMYLPKG